MTDSRKELQKIKEGKVKKTEEHFMFVNKKRLIAGESNPGAIYGSIREMVKENIVINNKVIKYATLFNLLGNEKYFNNEDYYIKKTEVQRSKMQNR